MWLTLFYSFKTWALGNKLALGLLATAAFKVLPPPGTPWWTYKYMYELGHQYLNIPMPNPDKKNATLDPPVTTNPQQP